MKRLALALVLPAVLVSFPPPAAGQEQDDRPVVLTLLEQSPVVTPRGELRIRAVAANRSTVAFDDLEVKLWIYNPARSRTAYGAGLTQEPPTEALLVTPFAFPGVLGPGQSRTLDIRREVPELAARGENALYPLKVQVESNGVAIGALRSALVFIAERPLVPLNVSLTFVLDHGVHHSPDGAFVDDGLERAMAPGGRLHSVVSALEAVPVPVTLAVSPVLLVELEQMSEGYRRTTPGGPLEFGPKSAEATAARDMLERLRDLAARPTTEVLALPYAAPSIPALVAAGLQADTARHIGEGRAVVERLLRVAPASPFRPPGGLLSRGAVRHLADLGIDALLVDPASAPPPPGLILSPPATAELPAGLGRTLRAIVPDPLAAARLTSLPLDPLLRARWVVGEISALYFEQPSVDRGVALVFDERTPVEEALLEPLLEALHPPALPRRTAWLRAVSASRLLAGDAPGGTRVLAPSRFATYPSSFPAAVAAARRAIARLESAAAERPPLIGDLSAMVLMAEARHFLQDPAAAYGFLGQVRTRVDAELSKVQPPGPGAVTLTSRGGVIPVTIRNDTGYAVRVRVLLRSPRLQFLDGDSREVLLQRQVQQLAFPVRAQTTGRFPVTVLLQAPDGSRIGESRLVVRSTAYNRAALFITGGAALFLALWWGRRFLPRTSG